MRHLLFILTIIFATTSQTVAADSGQHKFRLWFYLPTNLLVEENVERGIELLQRAEKSGYNGVLLADSKFCRWDLLPERYVQNVRRFRDECRKHHIECFAAVCPVGYSNDLLSRNPNLAEGLPVVDTPFVVNNGKFVPFESAEPILKNGGFENYKNNNPTDWGFVDEPGKISFIDEEIKYEGRASLRMHDIGITEPRNGRVMQTLHLKPFQYYHVSVMVKTENFDAVGAINIPALGANGMSLNWHFPPIRKTQDWKRIDVTFNTLENDTVNLYFGVWGGRRGTIWWDDVRVEPAGFVNLLRRNGTPLTVKSEDGKIEYTEEQDFEKIIDTKLGNDPYDGCFSAWHEQPTVKIPANSRIKEGQKVLISYYHTSIIYGEQVGLCMAEPESRELLRWQIAQVHKNLEPDGYFMSHDEMRQQGWDKSCTDTGKTPAELLADNVTFCVETIRQEDPNKLIAVWSDMFDPAHNASKSGYYYLVKGNAPWYGSWKKLPQDIFVANWNSNPETLKESLQHFDNLGNPQLLAGYYDAEPIDAIRDWMRNAKSFKGVSGVIYTTWTNNYDHLEKFAEEVQKELSK
ncbi:MAG: carbohydrate binding domain-containing protein [Planctomycetaceae bacterium]|jgi:hypothetical protein|nr:carbohydrate binding domain-containing protein [Planctomycetaceae bacterium]